MNQAQRSNLIYIDRNSSTPKYLQVAYSIRKAVEEGRMARNFVLPSLNDLAIDLHISRDTVERGYNYLRRLGVLKSCPGKGYFICDTRSMEQIRIFLLINKLSDYKRIFYDSLSSMLGNEALIDVYVYHNDSVLFEKLISKADSSYTHYLIMAHFKNDEPADLKLINSLPKHKLIILDREVDFVDGEYGGIYENFKKDIYEALEKLLKPLGKYHTLRLLIPTNSYFPPEIIEGFTLFCQQYAFDREVSRGEEPVEMNNGEVFICLTEEQLLRVIEYSSALNLRVGKDIGIISYNETPLKKYILNGITTLSTDFKQMGIEAANMIRHNYRKKIELQCRVRIRKSL